MKRILVLTMVLMLTALWGSPARAGVSIPAAGWKPQIIALTAGSVVNNSATSTTFTLQWAPATNGTGIYLYQWDPLNNRTTLYNGNAASPVTLTRTTTGTWRYQVLFGYIGGDGQLIVTGASNTLSVVVPTPMPPVLQAPSRPPVTEYNFRLPWTRDPGDFIYELEENTAPDFSAPGSVKYWPSANNEVIPPKPAGTLYYRVRSWNKLPENGGSASAWSNVMPVQVLNDEEFLDLVERKAFDYFLATTYPNGLTLDRYETSNNTSTTVSIASSAFYLSALTVGVERGWMDRAEGFNRAKAALQTFTNGTPNVHGFFYHFLKPDGTPANAGIEVSTIDTALLIAGALQAGEYFGGEVKTLADALYQRVEWDWMYDPSFNLLHQAWTQAGGFQSYYNSYNETMVLYLLAVASPAHPIPAYSFYAVNRPKGNYRGPDFIHNSGGRIFTYQYSHIWYDFRNTTDALGVNWWSNSIEGVRSAQRYAMDTPGFGYSQYLWGLTACDGPDGYKAYGAQPAYANTHDGTIAPTGVGASIPFAPDIAIPSLKYQYGALGDQIWKEYGFVDAFNLNRNWVDQWYLGIDQGPILLMLENRRSEVVWRYFMQNPHVIRSLSVTGFSGFAAPVPDVNMEDFEDGNFSTPDTTVGWWDSDGANVYHRANSASPVYEGNTAMKIDYSKNGYPYSFMGAAISAVNPKKDFSNHELLTVKVFGACDLLVKLRDSSLVEKDVATLKARNPAGWNQLTFDYSALNLDKKSIDNIYFFVDPGILASSGTVHFDRIRLEARKPLKVDDFEDGNFSTPDTSLGWWDVDGTRVYRHSQSKEPSLGGLGAMKIEYTKDGLPWSFFGGAISQTNPLRDFSKHTRLVVWVTGKADLLVKIRDRQFREVELGTGHSVNAGKGWTRMVFDFSKVNTVDLSDIDNILFFADPGNPNSAGTFWIDDITLE